MPIWPRYNISEPTVRNPYKSLSSLRPSTRKNRYCTQKHANRESSCSRTGSPGQSYKKINIMLRSFCRMHAVHCSLLAGCLQSSYHYHLRGFGTHRRSMLCRKSSYRKLQSAYINYDRLHMFVYRPETVANPFHFQLKLNNTSVIQKLSVIQLHVSLLQFQMF